MQCQQTQQGDEKCGVLRFASGRAGAENGKY
jgi:hypothetical protein